MSLSSGSLRGAVAALADLYAPASGSEYPGRVIRLITGLISTGSCSYNHIAGSRALSWQVEPPEVVSFPDAPQLFRQHLPEHPLLGYIGATGDLSAHRVSDVASDRQFRSLGLYRDFYRPAGVEYQLAVCVPAPHGGVIAIALNRDGGDFSDEECELMNLLRCHIGQGAAIADALSLPLPQALAGPDGQPLLTPRQAGILRLVADGYQDRAVARSLGISIRTVHTHLQHVYRALGVTSRTEALARLRGLPADGEPATAQA
jgi:DNA-binding CsgD family transcriptional regulator